MRLSREARRRLERKRLRKLKRKKIVMNTSTVSLSLLLMLGATNTVNSATVDDVRELVGKIRLDSVFTEEEQSEILRNYMSVKMHNTTADLFELNELLLDAMDFDSDRAEILSQVALLEKELVKAISSGKPVKELMRLKTELDRLSYKESRIKNRGDIISIERKENVWEEDYLTLMGILERIKNFKDIGDVGFNMKFPLDGHVELSSVFGERYDPITDEIELHGGVDFRTPEGTNVRAAWNGVVTAVFEGERSGIGVEITHDEGLITRYLHLSRVNVKKGDPVSQYDIIAESGNTGRSTGPHLHFEVILDDERINPLLLFGRKGMDILYYYLATTTDKLVGNEEDVIYSIKNNPDSYEPEELPLIEGVRPIDYRKNDEDVPEDAIEAVLEEGHETPTPISQMDLWEMRRVQP